MDRQGGRSRPSGVGTVFDGSLDWEAWCQVRPEESDILEVTGLAGLEGCDASKGVFWVQSIADVDALGLKLQVAFLGGSEGTTGPTLAQIFNRRKSVLHLCHGELPCSVDGCGGHATRFTRYKVYDYDVSYLHQEVAKAFKRRKREWDKLRGKGHSGDALSGGDDGSGRPRGDGLRAPVAGDHLDADPEEPRGEPLFPETGAGGTWGELKPPVELDRGAQFPVATDERRSALRKTLSEAKQRFHDAQGRGRQSRARPGGEPFSVFDSVPEGMPPPPTTKRDFKTNKKDSAEVLSLEDTKDTTSKPSKKRKAAEDDTPTTRGVLKQLVHQAAKEPKKEKASRRSRSSSRTAMAHRLIKTLAKGLGVRKPDKGEARKRRRRDGSFPPSSGPDGSDETSCSGDGYTDSSGADIEQKEKDKSTPPLERMSQRKAGSVLQAFVNHMRESLQNLDEGSLAPEYFHLQIKPAIGAKSREAREIYCLLQGIDLLRSGKLDQLGDLMAARAMACSPSVRHRWRIVESRETPRDPRLELLRTQA